MIMTCRKVTNLLIYIQLIICSSSTDVDNKWLQDVLIHEDVSHDVKQLLSLVASPAVKNQTSLGSEDTRLDMELVLHNGMHDKRSVILRSLPSTPAYRKQIAESGLFNIEIMAYRDALSKMEHILNAKHDKSEPLWVRALGFKEFEQLVLEDAEHELGYHTADRWKGMDRTHTFLALKGLAKFHALSAVANEQSEHKLQHDFAHSLLERNYEGIKDFYEVVYNKFAKVIEDHWGPEWAPAAKKVRDVAPHVKEKLLKLYQKRDSFLNTLNIGAPTIRNIYFKYDISDLYKSDKPIAVRFSYFQLAFFNSPAHDVQYFLNTSPELDVMSKQRQGALVYYFGWLHHYLHIFGYKGRLPTDEEFQHEFERNNFEGITVAIQILPLRFEPHNPIDNAEKNAQENMNSNTTILDDYGMHSKEYEAYMKVLLKKAIDEHVL